jgi:hypothetical protein
MTERMNSIPKRRRIRKQEDRPVSDSDLQHKVPDGPQPGTVVVGPFDQDATATIPGVPDGYERVTMISLGYPAKRGKAPVRKETVAFVHCERW